LLAGLGHEFMGAAADACIGIGERALDEFTRIDLGRNADDAKLVTIQSFLHLGIGKVTAEERIVDVHDGKVPDLTGKIDGFDDAARCAVAIRGIAVEIGGKVPDAGAVTLFCHEVPPFAWLSLRPAPMAVMAARSRVVRLKPASLDCSRILSFVFIYFRYLP